MSNAAMAQRILARNKVYIQCFEQEIARQRRNKTKADETGDIRSEYGFHNDLQWAKGILKQYVAEQKWLKQLCKGN